MKSFSLACVFSSTCVLSSAVLAANFAFAAGGQGHQLSSETSTNPGPAASKLVFAESSTQLNRSGDARSIIIVSGKKAPGSKVMLNPQPLPPRTNVNPSINSKASKVTLNPQPLPPGSKVTLSPQPLPPGAKVNTSINSNASKVLLNQQPPPPKTP